MGNNTRAGLPTYPTEGRHSISGLSSGAFMAVQLHVAHSASFVGAGVIAGGPYRAAETFRAAPTTPMSNILTSLYVAMTPLTAGTAPRADKLLALARTTPNIDDLENLAGQRVYLFTGTCDQVVNQHAVNSTRAFYNGLGITEPAMAFVDTVAAGHAILTTNPEDSPLSANQPPYINQWIRMQSHDILDHLYPGSEAAADTASGRMIRFEQRPFVGEAWARSSLAPYGYAYIPSRVAQGATAKGVHIVLHGCKQGYAYVDFVNGRPDVANQAPFGDRYIRTTGYMEWAEANDLLLLFPQATGTDNNAVQNPDGCWDWWGYTGEAPQDPDFYTRDAVQIRAIHTMLTRLAGEA